MRRAAAPLSSATQVLIMLCAVALMSAAFSWALNARLSDWGAFDILEMVTHILSWLGLALLFVVYPNTKPAPLLRISAALLLLPCIARLEAHLVLPHSMLGGTATAVLGAVAETSAAVACAMVIGHGCCIVPPRGAAGAGAAAPFLQQRRRHVPRQHATAQDPLITAATGSPSPSHYGSEYMLPSTPAYLFSWHSLCVCMAQNVGSHTWACGNSRGAGALLGMVLVCMAGYLVSPRPSAAAPV